MGVDSGRGRWEMTFRIPADGAVAPSGDVALAACLLPAMRLGETLEVDADVSPRLLAGAAVVQDVFCTWDRALRPTAPWYHPVEVRPAGESRASSPGRGATAAFFSGGVDSFHTAVVHRDEIDALVFVHGFDVALADGALRSEVSDRLRAAADALGLPLMEVETDLQAFGAAHDVPWPDLHGAAMAAVAHALADRFGRWLVPATHTYARLEGLGSHPLLDPLWSSETVQIEHVGATATRVDKLRRIAEEPAATTHLRVCWENRGGAYNCGHCEKCVRTGVGVRIAGVEGRFPTIPSPSLRTIATAHPTGRASSWHDLRLDLVASGGNPRLERAIDVAIGRHQLGRWRWTRRWFG